MPQQPLLCKALWSPALTTLAIHPQLAESLCQLELSGIQAHLKQCLEFQKQNNLDNGNLPFAYHVAWLKTLLAFNDLEYLRSIPVAVEGTSKFLYILLNEFYRNYIHCIYYSLRVLGCNASGCSLILRHGTHSPPLGLYQTGRRQGYILLDRHLRLELKTTT